MINMVKLPTSKSELFLRVAKGHFATSHSHINYYIDVTTQKTRLSEAKAVAKELVSAYQHSTIVDTVLCLDGTQVIGTCLANELTKDGFTNMNAHKTIYIVTPEYTSGSQIILRDNLAPMVKGKNVLILAASVTTGFAQRDEQLRGVEFFNVARFPTVTFRSTEMKFVGERPISAKGVLTLLGVSKPVELKISQFYCAPHPMNKKEMCGAEANVSIKRSEYGMNRYLPGIGDEVKLAVQIVQKIREGGP